MKRLAITTSLLAGAAFAVWGVSTHVAAQGNQTLVIQGGTLIDGNGGAPVANSVIVIQGNRITAVGRAYNRMRGKLEAIVHPLVARKQRAFLRRAAQRGVPLVVLDIPLLFEGRGERRVDAVMVVTEIGRAHV